MTTAALVVSALLILFNALLRAAGSSLVRTPRADALHDSRNGDMRAEKIASLLGIIARRDAIIGKVTDTNSLSFDLPLTREAMSDYLGLTLETVSRQISALKKDGVIILEGKRHIQVPDMDRLLEEAGDDSDGGFLA